MAPLLAHWLGQRRTAVGLVLLAITAAALRLGVLLVAGVHSEGNAFEHGEIAQNLLDGRGFRVRYLGVDGPTSQQAPLYPLLLAAAARVAGDLDQRAFLAVEVIQCLAGAGIALAVVALGWALFPQSRAIGWTAGWIAAGFPTHLYMATQIQVVVWATLLLTVLLALASRTPARSPWRRAVAIGIVAGLMLLVEPILALALPIVAVDAWRRDRRAGQATWLSWRPLLRTLCLAMVAAAVIAPWLVRNYRTHGEFVFVKSTFGYAFWQGNNEASWGTDKIPKLEAEQMRQTHDGTLAGMNRALWQARHETIYIDDLLLQPGGYREFQGLSEPARSRLLAARAWQAIEREPARYARLCLQRLKYFLLFDATNPKAANRLYRATTVVWLVLAVLGLLVTRADWRTLWPTTAIFVAITAFHCLTITSARFRMPLEPLTFIWIAAAIVPLASRLALSAAEATVGLRAQLASRWRPPADRPVTKLAPPLPHIPVGRAQPARRSHGLTARDERRG